MSEAVLSFLELSLRHVKKMLLDAEEPDLPPAVQDLPDLRAIHDYLVTLRAILRDFSSGDLSCEIALRGSLAGRLKALQANFLHLAWQIQQVADGDFSQRVDFMGKFSDAFNSMVLQLDSALTALRQSESELLRLTETLQQEIEIKQETMAALRQSEANFKYEAEHDALTGVLNRRSFYDRAVVELTRARLNGHYCGVGIFDIDRFKPFNDTFGHLNGDLALKHVTDMARETLRTKDIIGRFGGDEFVLFLSFSTEKAGKNIVERLRRAVSRMPVVMAEGKEPITISLGFICISPDLKESRNIDFLEKIISMADKALYRAKEHGRDRVSMRRLSNRKRSLPSA